MYLEAEETLIGRSICLRKMEMCRKCKDTLKQLCCSKRRRAGWGGRAPAALGLPGCLPALSPCWGRWLWARPWRESLQSGFSQADPCREIWSLAEMIVVPAPGAILRRGLSVQCQSCRDSGLLGSLSDPAEPWSQCRLQSPLCTRVWKAAPSSPWWNVGLVPLSCTLPRDLSFTVEFWVSLKCSVLVLPSLSSVPTSSLSPSFPLRFPVSDCLLSVLPTAHLRSPPPGFSATWIHIAFFAFHAPT